MTLSGKSLKERAIRGIGWTLVGYGLAQVLRLGSNLYLARILFPEDYGLMALAGVFLQGLNMLSDIGIGPSIIQNKNGLEHSFLATAWTMQILRGVILFLIMLGLSPVISSLYGEPVLAQVLVYLGFVAFLQGFRSIGVPVANRHMLLGQLTAIDLLAQAIGVVVMIYWALYISADVWVLVAGAVSVAACRFILEHIYLPSTANKLLFDWSCAREIFRFGKWIFLGTAFTFIGAEGLRLFQGLLIDVSTLGLIAIAGLLSKVAVEVISKIMQSVVFPAFAEVNMARPDEMKDVVMQARQRLFLLSMPIFLLMIIFSRDIVGVLYDDRYLTAGVYLGIMAVSAAISAHRAPFSMILLSLGDGYGHAWTKGMSAVTRVGGVFFGYQVGGVLGMLVGDVVAQLLLYPVEALRLKKWGLWRPFFDVSIFVFFIVFGLLSFIHGPFTGYA